jgi:hypothetical protein
MIMGLQTKKFKVIRNNTLKKKKKRAFILHISLTETHDDRLSGSFAPSALDGCVKEARESC